jgi:uncharacterized protein YbjT (DUF2867 family)
MPVIVVGADTEHGPAIIDALLDRAGQVRAFVTDEEEAERLRAAKVHVALGDVSDASHVEAASTRCFSAVLVTTAAVDGRERSFARSDDEVLRGWAQAIGASSVTRAIWVVDDAHTGWDPPDVTPERAVLTIGHPDLAAEVARLDDAASI